ncbi:MAG: hypothetical protein H0X42_06590 [Solirubrobacterales bacterium]|nr:hypothetical protein [Solirubrobacterales bacterium]
MVRGNLTLDLGIGRRLRPLGPIERIIAAPPEVVFDVIAGPYRRTPRAMADKLRIWERGEDMVLAEHLTLNGPLTTSREPTAAAQESASNEEFLLEGTNLDGTDRHRGLLQHRLLPDPARQGRRLL